MLDLELGTIVKFWGLLIALAALVWVLIAGGGLLYVLLTGRKELHPLAGASFVFLGWVLISIMLSHGVDTATLAEEILKGRLLPGVVAPGVNLQSLFQGTLLSTLVWAGLSAASRLGQRMLPTEHLPGPPPAAE